jgi:hypothetical protein
LGRKHQWIETVFLIGLAIFGFQMFFGGGFNLFTSQAPIAVSGEPVAYPAEYEVNYPEVESLPQKEIPIARNEPIEGPDYTTENLTNTIWLIIVGICIIFVVIFIWWRLQVFASEIAIEVKKKALEKSKRKV